MGLSVCLVIRNLLYSGPKKAHFKIENQTKTRLHNVFFREMRVLALQKVQTIRQTWSMHTKTTKTQNCTIHCSPVVLHINSISVSAQTNSNATTDVSASEYVLLCYSQLLLFLEVLLKTSLVLAHSFAFNTKNQTIICICF